MKAESQQVNPPILQGEKLEHNKNMLTVQQILKQYEGFKQEEIVQFRQAYNDVKLNRILGSIFGGMIGDALGAYCQFLKFIPQKIQNQVMDMPGGGTFKTILPGQYTDDNQLAYHLLNGLLVFEEKEQFESQRLKILCKIGLQFIRWDENGPFDKGLTCGAAIEHLAANKKHLEQQNGDKLVKVLQDINDDNQKSQSNGSLMRITPVAAFVSLFDIDPIKEMQFLKDQIRLTHPNTKLQVAGASWVYILKKLITRQSDSVEQFKSIMHEVENQQRFSQIREYFEEGHRRRSESMSATNKMGWAKIGFSYGYKFLVYLVQHNFPHNSEVYKEWIHWVICRAGDTDTNAAISGGLIGAVIGFQQLPIEYLQKIFKLKFPKENPTYTTKQPEYEPANFLRLVLKLIQKSKAYFKNKEKPNIDNSHE